MGSADFFSPGAWNRRDDRTGFKIKSTHGRKQWDGIITDRRSWEPRHEQDFIRSIVDRQAVLNPRVCPEVFITTINQQDDDGVSVPPATIVFAITIVSEDTADDTPTQAATVEEGLASDDTGTFTITLSGDPLLSTNTASVTVTLTGTAADADFTTTRMAALSAGAVAADVTFVDNLDDTATLTWDIDSSLTLDAPLTVVSDALVEGSETLVMTLSGASVDIGSASISSGSTAATLTITEQSIRVVVGCFQFPLVTGNVDWTVDLGGLTPKAVQFVVASTETDGTAQDGLGSAVGFVDGTSEYVAAVVAQFSVSQTTRKAIYNNRCIASFQKSAGVSLTYGAVFVSLIENGVRLNFDVVPATTPEAMFVRVTFFAGASLSATAWDKTISATEDTAVVVTGIGFEPDLVLSVANASSAFNTLSGQALFTYGAAHNDGAGTIVQKAMAWFDDDLVVSTLMTCALLSNRIGGIVNKTSIRHTVEISAFGSDGFSLTPRDANSLSEILVGLAFKFTGRSSWVGSLDSPILPGDWAQTGPGFTPRIVELGILAAQAEDTVEVDGDAGPFAVAAFDRTGNSCATSWADENGADPANNQTLFDSTKAINFTDDEGTQSFAATYSSMDASGWTLNFTVADGTTRKWFGWAVE